MVDFYALYKKMPGGLMLIPMFAFALINTLFPSLWDSLGSMSAATFKTGTLTVAGIILFATGAGLSLDALGETFRRAGVLSLAKVLVVDLGAGVLFYRLFGLEGFMGINAVAFVTAMCGCNAGVFAGVISDYGEPEDMGAFPMLNILSMPAIPVLVLAIAQGDMGSFDWMNVATILVPFVLGIAMGNLDPRLARLYGAATPVLLPFLGACLGGAITLVDAMRSGLSGIVLSLVVLAANVVVMVAADRLISRRPGYAAAAMCSVPGIAMSIGSFVGSMGYDRYLEAATAQIAFAVIITSLLAPFVTKLVVGLWGSPRVPARASR